MYSCTVLYSVLYYDLFGGQQMTSLLEGDGRTEEHRLHESAALVVDTTQPAVSRQSQQRLAVVALVFAYCVLHESELKSRLVYFVEKNTEEESMS